VQASTALPSVLVLPASRHSNDAQPLDSAAIKFWRFGKESSEVVS
jgi:hypothetical protein